MASIAKTSLKEIGALTKILFSSHKKTYKLGRKIGVYREAIIFLKMLWRFKKRLTDSMTSTFTLHYNGRSVGFIVLNTKYAPEITHLYVASTYRGAGFGTQLCDYVFLLLKNCSFRDVFLWVDVKNTVAIHFYKKLQFKETSKIKYVHSVYGDVLTLCKMEKEIK